MIRELDYLYILEVAGIGYIHVSSLKPGLGELGQEGHNPGFNLGVSIMYYKEFSSTCTTICMSPIG